MAAIGRWAAILLVVAVSNCNGGFSVVSDQLVPEDCYIQSSLTQGRETKMAPICSQAA